MMRTTMLVLTALGATVVLVVSGCGTPAANPPAAQPAPSPSASSVSLPATTNATTRPAKTPTSNVKDCFDADCALIVSKPIGIPLDTKLFYYPELTVVAITSNSVTYRVDYPHGGRAEQSLSPGGQGQFGFRSFTPVEVGLDSITDGTAILVLSPGAQ